MQVPKLFNDNHQLHLPPDLMEYNPAFLSAKNADGLLALLLKVVPWQQHSVMMYDREILQPRCSAWYGRKKKTDAKHKPLAWLPELLEVKDQVESYTGITFDGVLLNLYRDGNDSVAWHSDRDTLPGLKTEIASVSIGEERCFDFRRKTNHRQRYSIPLQHGSLLLMKGDLQRYWEHRIAKSALPMNPRINMTFRKTIL